MPATIYWLTTLTTLSCKASVLLVFVMHCPLKLCRERLNQVLKPVSRAFTGYKWCDSLHIMVQWATI